MEQSYSGTAPALERGLKIIELISSYDQPLSFTELEQQTNIPKATLNRLLKVLCGMNYLSKSPDGKYMPGSRCGIIGKPADTEAAMAQYGPDIVRQVCELTDNTCILFFWDGKQTRVKAKEMHEMSLSMQPIGNVSADYVKTPWGWIFLNCPELSDEVTADKQLYYKHADFYLKHGFMLDQQENSIRMAVPVISTGRTVGALALGASVSSPEIDSIIEYGEILKKYAQELSFKL